MGKSQEISDYLEEVGGIATTAQLRQAGFHPGSIAHAFDTGVIDKLTRGVYCTQNIFDDEFAAISKRWRKCVVSHESALYLAGLSDQIPSTIDVTIPHGYNPQALARDFPDVRIHRVDPSIHELGIVTTKSPGGGEARTYSAERAVADLIAKRFTTGADPQVIHDAIGGYFRREKPNLTELGRMCKALGVEDELRVYLEVLT